MGSIRKAEGRLALGRQPTGIRANTDTQGVRTAGAQAWSQDLAHFCNPDGENWRWGGLWPDNWQDVLCPLCVKSGVLKIGSRS